MKAAGNKSSLCESLGEFFEAIQSKPDISDEEQYNAAI